MGPDCTDLFDLPVNFTAEELKKRYRELAKENHPDRFIDPLQKEEAHGKFLQIQLCLDTLKVTSSEGKASSDKFGGSTKRAEFTWNTFTEYLDILSQRIEYDLTWQHHTPKESSTTQGLSSPLPTTVQNRINFSLYSHQAEAIDHFRSGENIVITTPTASGKSMAYMIPFMDLNDQDPEATAIFIFPMKALANDQFRNFEKLTGGTISQKVFDGNTSSSEKETIRNNPPNVLYTNPDEIHHSILYTSDKWQDFFKNLKLIVLDEIHVYKGAFGSHVANIMERLQVVVKNAGGSPQFVCTSATIADPRAFATRLTGRDFYLVDQSGAGQPEKYFAMLQSTVNEEGQPSTTPPTIAVNEAINLYKNGHQVIVFVNSRSEVDVLSSYTQEILKSEKAPHPRYDTGATNLPAQIMPENIVSGYHAGYSKEMRRDIEQKIKSGQTRIIFSTNALELGIDIGSLDACILLGIPPTNNEIWQRIGRAGRNLSSPSLVLIVNNYGAFDWYHFMNSDKFIGTRSNPDRPIIDPGNQDIRGQHLNAGVFEGIKKSDILDPHNWDLVEITDKKWWNYHRINVRGGLDDHYTLKDEQGNKLGEIEVGRAYRDLYPGAIYTLNGKPFIYVSRDWKEKVFVLKPSDNPDVFTTPFVEMTTDIDSKAVIEETLNYGKLRLTIGHGAVSVVQKVVSYNERLRTDPQLKIPHTIKYPDKWPKLKTKGFWLGLSSNSEKEWNKVFERTAEGRAWVKYEFLHTLEHMIIREAREMGLCDWVDLAGASSQMSAHSKSALTIVYEPLRGGLGLSEALYEKADILLQKAYDRLHNCPCENGCPACALTPPFCHEYHGWLDKNVTRDVLQMVLNSTPVRKPYSRTPTGDLAGLVLDPDRYQIGDSPVEGWVVIEITEDGFILQSTEGDIQVVPFEDTPL